MTRFLWSEEEEDQLERELAEKEQRFQQSKKTLTPALSKNFNDFYQQFPYASPDLLLPAVQAFTDGRMSADQVQEFLNDMTRKEIEKAEAEKNKPKQKSWWERNVTDKVRTGSRWAMAALEFVPQTVQNLASMGYQAGKRVKRDGWGSFFDAWETEGMIISTDLGTLIANDKEAGSGFFIGGRAKELQAERARRFRGTINGSAFTIGRGLALTVSQPGTKEYRYLSGLVDATAAIVTPSVPGGKIVAGAIKGATKSTVARAGLRTLAGLTDYESAFIDPSKVSDFLNSNPGRQIIKKLSETNTVDELMEIFPTADARFLVNVAETTDEVAMTQLLKDTLGIEDATRGIAPRSIEDINISRWDNVKRNIVQRESYVARLMSAVPGRHVVIAGGSDREVMQSLSNIKNYLRQLKVDPEERAEIVGRFAKAFAEDDGSMRLVTRELQNTVRDSFVRLGVDRKIADEIMGDFSKNIDNMQKDLWGHVGNSGAAEDLGEMFETIVDGKVVMAHMPLGTAHLQSEMMKHSLMLPDPRRTRRIASNIGWITGKGGFVNPEKVGELRTPLVVIEALQNYVWRPFTLMTGGYVLRNMADSLLRQTVNPNVKTGLFHPLELMQVAMFKKFKGDILGDTFKGDPEELLRAGQRDLAEAAAGTVREALDPKTAYARQRLTGSWRRVRIGDGKNDYMKGVAAELSLLASDDVARMVANGDSVDDIVRALVEQPNLDYVRKLQNRWRNVVLDAADGEKMFGTVRIIDEATGQVNAAALQSYIRTVAKRVDKTTGGSPVLKEIVATGKYTDSATNEVLDALQFDTAGRISGYNENIWKPISDAVDDPNVPLKEFYKMQDEVSAATGTGNTPLDWMKRGYDVIVDKFFSELYPKREAFLNRSPVFRQYYYEAIGRLTDELGPGEVDSIFRNLENAAKEAGKKFNKDWVASYVGSRNLADDLFDMRSGVKPSAGRLTVEQIDAYAKGYALDETKRVFYNAAEKSNFADIMRIVAPFGSAWAEVTKRWAKNLSSNPETMKRAGVTVQGLIEGDPDNDGKGFFYKDPNTGEYVFNYPFSEQLAPFMLGFGGAVTGAILGGIPGALALGGLGAGAGVALQPKLEGLDTTFVAPAKSLSMGLSFLPGVGPYVQVAANAIIGDKPQLRDIRSVILPYGEPDVSWFAAPVPAWAQKVIEGITAKDSDRFYGDVKLDVIRALGASGDYDLTTAEGRQELEKDASQKARWLMILRGVGQFVGPTRPTPEFTVVTKQGDMYSNEVSKLWYDLSKENYDTAVERFLDIMGDDFFIYMAGKNKSIDGGLESTVEFADWQAQNKDFFDRHSEVAGYFAPVGSTYDYQVFLQNQASGGVRRRTPQELIADAQARVGIALYRSLVRQAGPNPNKAQEDILRQAREEIGERYPGFRDRPIDIKAEETRIRRLQEAAFDPALSDNPVAQGLIEYFKYRDEALRIVEQRGYTNLSGKNVADLRAILRQAGESIAVSVPEFERVWERVLFNEVDLM